jgi:molecular chaperone DnaK
VSEAGTGEPKLLPLRIRLPFGSEAEFIERYGANVDKTSLFIATKSTKPEGTAISFELVLQDGTRLMRGEGVVTEAREGAGSAGMRLRFTRLEAKTKALVDQIVARQEPQPEAPQPGPAAIPPPAPSAPPRTLPTATDAVVGIDFGTSRCRAAVVIDGEAQLISFGGEPFLPAVVAVDHRGKPLAGVRAAALAAAEPERALWNLKRLLGRRARSQRLQEDARRLGVAVSPDAEGEVQVELSGRTATARALAAALLEVIRRAASEKLGAEVRRAVLGVPAWFTHRQRRALMAAASDAGLEVVQLLNEPSAVALAFAHGKGLARKRVLVYDFGGGAFDAAVVELTGDDLEVVSTGGDDALGGADFDSALLDALAGGGAAARQRAEAARVALSTADSVTLGAQPLARAALESAVAGLVDHSLKLTHAVLESAKLTPQGLDEVVATGGLFQMPLVRTRLEAALGRVRPTQTVADGAVAIGAALYGHSLHLREQGKNGSTVAEVLGAPLAVAMQGGGVRRVLDRNTRLPATKTLPVPVAAGQPLTLTVFQGARPLAIENEFLGTVSLPAERPGELLVRFSLSADGVLELSASSATGRELRVEWQVAEAEAGAVEQAVASATLPAETRTEGPSKGIFGGFLRLFGRP